VPVQSHELVKMAKRGNYVACKRLRYRDKPRKRLALGQITSNLGKESGRHTSSFGYKQCDVYLYDNNSCFESFHKEK
jgi:hypothetical protein